MDMRKNQRMLLPSDLVGFENNLKRNFGGIFAPGRDVFIARAPARLDIMGGIADYSGSVVLESTLNEATIVAVQKRHDNRILIRSLGIEQEGFSTIIDSHLDEFYDAGELKSYAALHEQLTAEPAKRWSAFVLGAFSVLLNERLIKEFETGANVGIQSNIPLGAGVSSSAALEVAVMLALSRAFAVKLDPFQIARSCQIVENAIVGAPCGIMDQVTSAMGERNKLLAMRCQPHEIIKMIDVPGDVQFIGINSGVKHSVSDARYVDARVATFMGRKILFSKLQTQADVLPYGGYLCNISPEDWDANLKKLVPAKLKGKEFLETYKSHDDPATVIDPEKNYKPKSRTEHPIKENDRVIRFMGLLDNYRDSGDESNLERAGELMFESHESYSKKCGLGSKETDLLVRLIRESGPENGLYGAKITGGGSGGTVAVLAAAGAEAMVQNITAQYRDLTNIQAEIFNGSSPGALELGVKIVKFK